MNYHDAQAQLDIVLAALQHGESDAPSAMRTLEGIRKEVIATADLKSIRWLLPQIETWIGFLAESCSREVPVSA